MGTLHSGLRRLFTHTHALSRVRVAAMGLPFAIVGDAVVDAVVVGDVVVDDAVVGNSEAERHYIRIVFAVAGLAGCASCGRGRSNRPGMMRDVRALGWHDGCSMRRAGTPHGLHSHMHGAFGWHSGAHLLRRES